MDGAARYTLAPKVGVMAAPPWKATQCDFSTDRVYRYDLWRNWTDGRWVGSYAMFIGLNPSTADEVLDDPTVRRCMGYAYDWGYRSMVMSNLFAFRATDPAVMRAAADPVGPDNDASLIYRAKDAALVVACWGIHGVHHDRAARVRAMLEPVTTLTALRLTKGGHPAHPLYLPGHLKPVPLSGQADLFGKAARE